MRASEISPQRSRSSLKRFALSLLASATLLALSDPSFAFTYEYIDRYPEPITTHNAWQPVEVNEEHPLQFEGDYVIGFHGKDIDSHSSSSSDGAALHVNIQTGRRDVNEMTITGRTLHIIERPYPAFSGESLSNLGIKFAESVHRDNGPTTFTVNAALDLDLQSYNQVIGYRGHAAFMIESRDENVELNVTTNKRVTGIFYSTVGYDINGSDNTWPKSYRFHALDGSAFHYQANDVVDMKIVSTEPNVIYGFDLQSSDLVTHNSTAHFAKDATFYIQAQKGSVGWIYGSRIAAFNDILDPTQSGKSIVSNDVGSTYRAIIETKNQPNTQTWGAGIYLIGNTRLAMAGKTELTFWEDPTGEASKTYYGVYSSLATGQSYAQHFNNTFNELVINVDAPKLNKAYGVYLRNYMGIETTTRISRADLHFNTAATAPTGLYFFTKNPNSQQNVIVSEALTFESTSPVGATMAAFSSSAGGRIDAQIKDVTLTTKLLAQGVSATATGTDSSTKVALEGTVTTTIESAGRSSALLYASAEDNAQSATIDFTGGGTLKMPDGILMASLGSNALINVHPTLATELTGLGYAAYNGKIDFRLTQSNQTAQMSIQSVQATGGVIDMTLENAAQWQAIGPTSHVNTLTLQTQGLVDLRSAQGADGSDTLGQAFLYTRALQGTGGTKGTGGTIALDVNTETNLGQILVIEERSEGAHQLRLGNRASAVATGVPIKVVESVGGETSDAFTATFSEETPVEVGELKYYVVKTNDAKAMYATLTGATTDESAEHSSDNASEHASDHADPAADSTADVTPAPSSRRRVARAAAEPVAEETSTEPAIVTDVAADTNPNNWYLAPRRVAPEPEPTLDPTPEPTPEPQPDPLPDFTDTAKGMVSTASVQYLAAMLPLETLRERLGDIHTFKPLDNKATPWVKLSGTEWRVKPTLTQDTWDVNFAHAKVGVDTRVGDKSLVGGYLAYSRFDTQHPAPAFVKGTGLEGGFYWTYLSENRTFSDLVLRVGRVEAKFDTTDTRGMSVKARDIDNTYWGLTWNVGRQIPLTQTVVLEPMALVGYTRFGSTRAVSSSGLTGDTRGYDSLLTMLGSTVEGRFTTSSGKPWTLYGKLFWEKEWLADTDIVFNGYNRYRTDFKDHRWVYGFGIEGMLGKASTWHVDVERSTGSALRENWQVNAGLRIPF